jgi:hypothetical protein
MPAKTAGHVTIENTDWRTEWNNDTQGRIFELRVVVAYSDLLAFTEQLSYFDSLRVR